MLILFVYEYEPVTVLDPSRLYGTYFRNSCAICVLLPIEILPTTLPRHCKVSTLAELCQQRNLKESNGRIADGLTKALPHQRHEDFVRLIRLDDITEQI